MADLHHNQTRTRILEAAEALFTRRGYAAVRLRDIAAAVGMRHASLYYYVPGGKEQLFIEVLEHCFERHRQGLTAAIAGAGDDLQLQIYAVADWLVSQPPIDATRMVQADMPAIDAAHAERLMTLSYNALREPIVTALLPAQAAGQVNLPDLNMAAMALVRLVQSVHSIPPQYLDVAPVQIGRQLADMLLHGWLERQR